MSNNATAELLKEKIAAIAAIENDLPSIIIIHNLETRSVEYMSARGLKILNTTLKELQEMGPGYFDIYFNPEDAQTYTPKILAMLDRNDPEEVISYFQQVRGRKEEEFKWYLSASKVFMCDEKGEPSFAITAAHPADELKSFTYKIEKLLGQNEMMRGNLSKFARLTNREKQVIKLLVEGHSSASIAEKLYVSFFTIEQHRKNIKNKLGVKNMPELVKFAQAFDLV
ncbi:MAG TPA: helix-turn-helix transcriptional regulator [Chitinophagaceae bacterium]|nr:helix-turn-helix transcriptional regulator [Chitinophagaceae bacterium]